MSMKNTNPKGYIVSPIADIIPSNRSLCVKIKTTEPYSEISLKAPDWFMVKFSKFSTSDYFSEKQLNAQ